MSKTEAIKAFRRALAPLKVTPPLLGSEWADKCFYLSPESSGAEGRWKCYPYQVALLNWMTSDDIEEVDIQKSRRIGYTKMLLVTVGYYVEQKIRNVAVWHPTDGDAHDFVIDEVDTMLRDVSILGEKLKCKVEAKSKHNTISKKVFHGATLDIKGGKSARNFRRMTKDVAIYDETDGFDIDIDNEGNCFELGDGRLDQAPFPKSIRGSTPKTKGMSLIETAVENCDMIFYRFVRCPKCGAMQRLIFENLKWEHGKAETAHFVCVKEQCRIEYRDYPSMDANGRWQTTDGYWYDEKTDHFFDPDDKPIAKPRRIGVRIWAGYSYLRPWSYVVDRWLDGNKNAKAGNITTLKTVINTLLGKTFEERGETVSPGAIGARCEDYLGEGRIPDEVLVITVGADVQGGAHARIELEILGHGLDGETWSLDYMVLNGAIERPVVWEKMDEQLRRRFVREDGVSIGVAATFIDSGYLANEVYRFTAPRRKRNIFATKGVNLGTLCNRGSWQGDKKKRTYTILRTMNVDDAKTIIFNRLRISQPGPGFCHFPAHYDDMHFTKLTNEEKLEKRKRGVLVGYEWIKKGPNEQLDCRAYAMGAEQYLNPNYAKTKMRLDKQAEALTRSDDVETVEDNYTAQMVNKKKKRTKGRPKKGWIGGWK